MKSKKREKKPKKAPTKPVKKEEDAIKSKEFDFGGIPARDVKKNLGCG